MPLRWRLPSAVTPRADDLPLRLVGAWHLVCAVTGGATLLPALPLAVRHPVGWLTLALLAFVVCLTCLPDRGAELRADSA